MANLVNRLTTSRVLAHGNAGVGKTTTVHALEEHLLPASVVITYDCFGGGAFLDPGEARHTLRRFALQVANELAVRCGTPFLIPSSSTDEEDTWARGESKT